MNITFKNKSQFDASTDENIVGFNKSKVFFRYAKFASIEQQKKNV